MLDPTKAQQMKSGAEMVRRLRAQRCGENMRRKSVQKKAEMSALDILRTTSILSKLAGNL